MVVRFARFLVIVIRFPADVVLLTSDWVRWTWRLLTGWFRHGAAGLTAPISCDLLEFADCDGTEVPLCNLARKYGSGWLFRLLCPWCQGMRSEAGRYYAQCTRNAGFRVFVGRYLVVGAFLAVVWGSAGAAAVLAWRENPLQLPWVGPQGTGRAAAADMPEQSATGRRDTSRSLELTRKGDAALAVGDLQSALAAYREALYQDGTSVSAALGLARTADRMGLADESERAYRRVVSLTGTNREARLALARSALEARRLDAARGHAEAVLGVDPKAVPAHLIRSHCCRAVGLHEDALAHCREALDLAPEDAAVHVELGSVHLARNELDAARDAFCRALVLEPGLPAAQVGLAEGLRRVGEPENARRVLEPLLESHPDDPEVLMAFAETLMSAGDRAQAIDLYREFCTAYPRQVVARARLSEILIDEGRFNEGLRVAQKLLADDPGNIPAHLVLAELYLRRRLPSLGVAECRRALAKGADGVRAHELLARCCLAEGSVAEAREVLLQLVARVPRRLDNWLVLAACEERLGSTEKAFAALNSAVTHHPQAPEPHVHLGRLHLMAGNDAAAEEAYRTALHLSPGNVRVLNNLAVLLLQQGRALEEALELAERAHGMVPSDPALADTLAWAYLASGQSRLALPLATFAAYRRPGDADMRFRLGVALCREGQREQGIAHLRAALALEPGFVHAAEARKLLAEAEAGGEP